MLALGMMLLTGCGNKANGDGSAVPTVAPTGSASVGTTTSTAEQEADAAVVKTRAEELAGQVAVTVGDLEITMDSMMMFIYSMENLGAQYEYYYQLYYQTSFWNMVADESGTLMKDVYKDYVMNSAIQYGVLYQKAIELGMTMTEEDKTENQAFVDEIFANITADELERAGFTRDKLLETVEFMTYAEKYYNSLIDGFGIDEEEIKAEVNQEDYKEYETEYLYLSTSSYDENYQLVERTEEEKAEDYVFIQDVLAKLKAGSTMAELKEANDNLTHTTRTFMEDNETIDATYIEAAIALENGEYSDIVETKYGYYIILMVDNNCTDSYLAALDDAYGAKVDTEFQKAFAELEVNYTQTINEEVWGPIELGNTIIIVDTEAVTTE